MDSRLIHNCPHFCRTQPRNSLDCRCTQNKTLSRAIQTDRSKAPSSNKRKIPPNHGNRTIIQCNVSLDWLAARYSSLTSFPAKARFQILMLPTTPTKPLTGSHPRPKYRVAAGERPGPVGKG